MDDQDTSREALSAIVHSVGWEAVAVATGEAAVERFRQALASGQPFELVLMDWHLPGTDGLAARQAIRDVAGSQDSPLILLVTAYELAQVQGQRDVAAVHTLLAKPVTASALFDTLGNLESERGSSGPVSASPSATDATTPPKPLAGLRVLVVDDNETNRDVAWLNLDEEGAQVSFANHGRAALEWLTDHPGGADVVLMDVQMPIMDGYEATRQIRATLGLTTLPIVALSAGAFREQREAALAAGMDGFLTKPFDMEVVVST